MVRKSKFKVIIIVDPPIIFTDKWLNKPSKNQVLEWLADQVREGNYDRNFHVVIEETKKET